MRLYAQAKRFVTLLKKLFGKKLVSVILFGSVARNTTGANSDIDLLLVIRDLPKGRLRRRALLDKALDMAMHQGLDGIFNCHLKSPDEAKHLTVMYYDMVLDGKILHDEKHFFAEILGRARQIMVKNGAKRVPMGDFYYWDLKPSAKADEIFEIL